MTEGEHAAQRREDGGDAVDPLLKAIGKQIKFLRERAGLTQTELGERIGYSKDLVASVERGRRPPKPPLIDGAERVLNAGGLLKAVEGDVERARLPAGFRDFALWEKEAVSIYAYEPLTIPGLLQTEDFARALVGGHCPPLSEATVEDRVTARLGRQSILERPVACHGVRDRRGRIAQAGWRRGGYEGTTAKASRQKQTAERFPSSHAHPTLAAQRSVRADHAARNI